MAAGRPDIPEQMARDTRKRCGFGCVICGCPVVDVDHIVEYKVVRCHKVENLTALCPAHHREKTAGRLAASQVFEHNAVPFNSNASNTAGHPMLFNGGDCELRIGSNRLVMPKGAPGGSAITVNGTSLVSFRRSENFLLLSMGLRDSSGTILLAVLDNVAILSTKLWDVVWEGQRLEVRASSTHGEVTARIKFVPPGEIVIERLDTWHDGHHIQVKSDGDLQLDDGVVSFKAATTFLYMEWGSAITIKDGPPGSGRVEYGSGGLGMPISLAAGLQIRA